MLTTEPPPARQVEGAGARTRREISSLESSALAHCGRVSGPRLSHPGKFLLLRTTTRLSGSPTLKASGRRCSSSPGDDNLAPTERFLHWLPLSIAPMNYGLGEAIILVLTAALLVSLLWVLRELRADPVVTLTVIFFVGTSVIVLYEAFDYDQVTFLFPGQYLHVVRLGIVHPMDPDREHPLPRGFVGGLRSLLPHARTITRSPCLSADSALLGAPVSNAARRTQETLGRLASVGFRLRRSPWRTLAITDSMPRSPPPNTRLSSPSSRVATALFVRALLGLPLQGVPRWVTPQSNGWRSWSL